MAHAIQHLGDITHESANYILNFLELAKSDCAMSLLRPQEATVEMTAQKFRVKVPYVRRSWRAESNIRCRTRRAGTARPTKTGGQTENTLCAFQGRPLI